MNLLQQLAGADTETLERFPTERRRYTGMGGAILLTGGFAALAGTFFLHDFLYVPIVFAIAIGLCWGVGIMNLDRWMLVSTRRQEKRRTTLLIALPRVLLAALIGIVIAEPVVLRIFHVEVAQEARQLKKDHYAAARKAVNGQYVDIKDLQSRQTALRASLVPDPITVLSKNPRYTQLKQQDEDLYARLTKARRDRQCQFTRKCATTRSSRRLLQNQIRVWRNQIIRGRKEMERLRIDARKAQFAQAPSTKADLDSVTRELNSRRAQRRQALVDARDDYLDPIGLMDRIEALHALISDRTGTAFFTWVLRALIFLIDLVPILFKTLSLLGKPTAAELDEEARENEELRRLEARRKRDLDRDRQAHEAELDRARQKSEDETEHEHTLRRNNQKVLERHSELAVLEAETNQRLVAERTEQLQRQILDVQTEVAEAVIDAWHEEALAAVPDLVQRHTSPRDAKPPDPLRSGTRQAQPSSAPPAATEAPIDDQVKRRRITDSRGQDPTQPDGASFIQHIPASKHAAMTPPSGGHHDAPTTSTPSNNGHSKDPAA